MNALGFSPAEEWWVDRDKFLVPCFVRVGLADVTVCTGMYSAPETCHAVLTTAGAVDAAQAAARLVELWQQAGGFAEGD